MRIRWRLRCLLVGKVCLRERLDCILTTFGAFGVRYPSPSVLVFTYLLGVVMLDMMRRLFFTDACCTLLCYLINCTGFFVTILVS
jgi:hypothetical protein